MQLPDLRFSFSQNWGVAVNICYFQPSLKRVSLRNIFVYALLASLAYHHPALASDEDFLDPDIPEDWRDYIPKDMLDVWKPETHATGLFQGDIAGVDPNAITSRDSQSNAVSDETLRWPHKLIPYEFGPQLTDNIKEFTLKAINDIHSKTCIRFVPRNNEEDYIVISAGLACWSYVGRMGKKQIVSLHRTCQDGLGATQHELMHVIGIIHEHTRPDRDEFVWINQKNIPTEIWDRFGAKKSSSRTSRENNYADNNTVTQFTVYSSKDVTDLQTPYDYNSVMHYGWNAFARNKDYPTILPKQKGTRIGQRQQMSQLDVERINKLYKCDEEREVGENIVITDYTETFTNWFVLCDGKNDLPDGWDENPDVCLKMCFKLDNDLFNGGKVLFNLPTTKRCMRKEYLCDGIQDSAADISEDKELCKKYCRGGGYIAIAPSYQCIHFMKLCDSKMDIRDGSDEIKDNCLAYCHSEIQGLEGQLFNLEPTGRCMMKIWLCDGIKDSDPFDTTEDPEICQRYCKGSGFFPTPDASQCIHWRNLCDGRRDTVSGWDEVRENCRRTCPVVPDFVGQLVNLPPADRCLSKRWLCDGIKDSDTDLSEDEEVCQKYCVGNGYFPTADTSQCIRVTDLCDGKQDTRNGWDEQGKNCLQFCKLMNLEGNLRISPKTKRCFETTSFSQ